MASDTVRHWWTREQALAEIKHLKDLVRSAEADDRTQGGPSGGRTGGGDSRSFRRINATKDLQRFIQAMQRRGVL